MKSVLWTLTLVVCVSAPSGAQSISGSEPHIGEPTMSVADALALITPEMPAALSRARCRMGDTVSLAALEHQVPPAAKKEAGKGDSAAKKGRVAEAIEHYRNALSIDPDDLIVRMNLGGFYLRTGAPADAADQFQAVVRIDPRAAGAYAGLGTAQLGLGDPGAAERTARKAIELDGALDVAHYVLGASLAAQNRSGDEILANLEKATGRFPGARLLAARILAANGNVTAARRELEQYLIDDPDGNDSSVRGWFAWLQAGPEARARQ